MRQGRVEKRKKRRRNEGGTRGAGRSRKGRSKERMTRKHPNWRKAKALLLDCDRPHWCTALARAIE